MGDEPPPPSAPSKNVPEQGVVDGQQESVPSPRHLVATEYPRPELKLQHPQDHHGSQQQNLFPKAYMGQPQGAGPPGSYNSAATANTQPQPAHRRPQHPRGQQRFNTVATSSPGLPNQVPAQQFGPQPPLLHQPPLANAPYYLQHHPHMPQYFPNPISPSHTQTNTARAPMGYYPNPLVMNQPGIPPPEYYYAQASHFQPPGHGIPGQLAPPQYLPSAAPQSDPRFSQMHAASQPPMTISNLPHSASSSGSRHGVVRGPPRKPRQSGHAIWIGNLPPQADLMSLVQHVCQQASGLESLFLISKSNCAFANFGNEQSCAAAQHKIHDSIFQTVRLVSRLRKNAIEAPAPLNAPTGPAASSLQSGNAEDGPPATVTGAADVPSAAGAMKEKQPEPVKKSPTSSFTPASELRSPVGDRPTSRKDMFFVLKSLTVEDLELSARTGIWATQSHNEETLNRAFESADNVYLIFSANKSGEYFGYARMTSPINNDPAAAIEFAPKVHSTSDLELPKAIPTEATEFTPRGRIIDDSARGTIFWEAERKDANPSEGEAQQDGQEVGSRPGSAAEDAGSERNAADGAEKGETKAWGKPFRLEWLSTTRLPFYRTRGLRNSWNSNREVKIARDGTELEPTAGRRLIGLFNKTQKHAPPPVMPGAAGGSGAIGGTGVRGVIPTMVPGFPPMKSPYQS